MENCSIYSIFKWNYWMSTKKCSSKKKDSSILSSEGPEAVRVAVWDYFIACQTLLSLSRIIPSYISTRDSLASTRMMLSTYRQVNYCFVHHIYVEHVQYVYKILMYFVVGFCYIICINMKTFLFLLHRDVKSVLLKIFSDKTIWIGHGLYKTLRVLRVIIDAFYDIHL